MSQEKTKWRDICEAMVKELDDKKVSELAAQLVAALDEQRLLPPPKPKKVQAASSQP